MRIESTVLAERNKRTFYRGGLQITPSRMEGKLGETRGYSSCINAQVKTTKTWKHCAAGSAVLGAMSSAYPRAPEQGQTISSQTPQPLGYRAGCQQFANLHHNR